MSDERQAAGGGAPPRRERLSGVASGRIKVPRAAAWRAQANHVAPLTGMALLVLALTLVPYLCGYLLAPPGKSFLGALNNSDDLSQYLAAIRQGAAGAWRYSNQFSPEHPRALVMYTPYLLIGHCSLGLSPAAAFQALRLLCGGLLLYALARFCRLFLGEAAVRGSCLFVLLAGGLYWLALLLSAAIPSLIDVKQLTAPELNPLIAMLISPHESLGLAAELMGFICLLGGSSPETPLWAPGRLPAAERNPGSRLAFGAAAWFAVLALSYPFLLPTVGAVLAVQAVVAAATAWNTRIAAAAPRRRLRAGRVFASQVRLTAIALLPAGLIALYYLDAFHRDPLWSRTGMAYVNRPDLMVLCFAYGPLVLAAWAGCRTLAAMRRAGGDAAPSAKVWFPLTWSLTNGVALLLPIWQQGRQALGLSVPLALLAFLWLAGPRAANGIRPALHTLPAALLVMSAPFLLAIYTAVTASGINQGYYLPNGVPKAVEWLGVHGTASDVVLADPVFGNQVPIHCPCHVVVGQYFETIDFARRQAEVLHFYQAPSNAAALASLRAIVRREHATLVVYSPLEHALPSARELSHLPGFALVYDRQDVTIFRLAIHA